jgi:adenylylsulfate kinase-like enzyme
MIPNTSPNTNPKPQPLIWINGYPGTGKLTIAKFLVSQLLGNSKAMLIHNHILIDPIYRRFGDSVTPADVDRIRHALREGFFENYVRNEDMMDRVIVFTGMSCDRYSHIINDV